MRLNHIIQHKRIYESLIYSLIAFNILFLNKPSKAFVPYIFEPSKENLKETSVNFGKTAAKLIYFRQIKEAQRLAELSVQINPKDERLWAILAETQIRSQQFKKASFSLKQAKKINPQNAKLWFAEGSLELQQKQPKNAAILLKKGLTIDPKNSGAYFQLGNARIMLNQLPMALRAFKKATTIEPKFWEALNNQGLVLYEIGEIEKAIEIWRNVLDIEENAEPMLALAAALNFLSKGNEESLKLTKKALSLNPNYVSNQYQAEQLWGEKLQQASKELFQNPSLLIVVQRAKETTN